MRQHKFWSLRYWEFLGEMARLVGKSDVAQQRLRYASELAALCGGVVVLKDSTTTIASANGSVWILEGANSGLAKGGSGDVLAGIIASLCAQGATPEQAAVAGVWIHSRAGLLARERFGERSMLPSDVIDCLPQAFIDVDCE